MNVLAGAMTKALTSLAVHGVFGEDGNPIAMAEARAMQQDLKTQAAILIKKKRRIASITIQRYARRLLCQSKFECAMARWKLNKAVIESDLRQAVLHGSHTLSRWQIGPSILKSPLELAWIRLKAIVRTGLLHDCIKDDVDHGSGALCGQQNIFVGARADLVWEGVEQMMNKTLSHYSGEVPKIIPANPDTANFLHQHHGNLMASGNKTTGQFDAGMSYKHPTRVNAKSETSWARHNDSNSIPQAVENPAVMHGNAVAGADGLYNGPLPKGAMGSYLDSLNASMLPNPKHPEHVGTPFHYFAHNVCTTLESEKELQDKNGMLAPPSQKQVNKDALPIMQTMRSQTDVQVLISCGHSVLAAEKHWLLDDDNKFIVYLGDKTLKMLGTSRVETIVSGRDPAIKTNMGKWKNVFVFILLFFLLH